MKLHSLLRCDDDPPCFLFEILLITLEKEMGNKIGHAWALLSRDEHRLYLTQQADASKLRLKDVQNLHLDSTCKQHKPTASTIPLVRR